MNARTRNAAVAEMRRTVTAGRWLRTHATEVLVGLLESGRSELALKVLTDALGMTADEILGQLESERARRAANGDGNGGER